MADEVQTTFKVTATKNSVTITNAVSTITHTMQGSLDKLHHTIQGVGTSEEALSVGDVDITNATGDEYGILVVNRDGTNFVQLKKKTAATPTYWEVTKLEPGEGTLIPRAPKIDGSSLGDYYLVADTAACNCEVCVWELGAIT